MTRGLKGSRSGVTKTCAVCSESFYVHQYRAEIAQFCSRTCKGIANRKAPPNRACAACAGPILSIQPDAKYCGLPCAAKGRLTGADVNCAQCGGTFYRPRGRKEGRGRFCSQACQNEWQGRNKTTHECRLCGKKYKLSPCFSVTREPMYCSRRCRLDDPINAQRLREVNAALQRGKVTRAEVAGYAILDELGVDYAPQVLFKNKFTPDATIAAAQILVQFDGDYWHDRAGTSVEPRIRKRVALDRSQDAYARACGWTVVRLWETDLLKDPHGCADRVLAALRLSQEVLAFDAALS